MQSTWYVGSVGLIVEERRRANQLCGTGSGAMVTLGIYTYHSGMKNLEAQRAVIEASRSKYKMGSRKLGIVALAASLVGAGLWRAVN